MLASSMARHGINIDLTRLDEHWNWYLQARNAHARQAQQQQRSDATPTIEGAQQQRTSGLGQSQQVFRLHPATAQT